MAEMSSEREIYLSWKKEDWENASEEEKTECCIALAQKILGLDDETFDLADDKDIQESLEQIKKGINQLYGCGDFDNYTVAEFVEMMQE